MSSQLEVKNLGNSPGAVDIPTTNFKELAMLNAGVILEPLASGTPVIEFDENLVLGLSGLSSKLVKETVRDHAFEGEETLLLLDRFREIKARANSLRAESIPLTEKEAPKKERKTPRHPSLEELIERYVFSDPDEPNFANIPAIIAKQPSSPELLETLFKTFSKHRVQYEVDDENEPLELFTAIHTGYEKYLFGKPNYTEDQSLIRITSNWLASMKPSEPVELSVIKQLIIAQAIDMHDPQRTLAGLNKMTEVVTDRISRALASGMSNEDLVKLYYPIIIAYTTKAVSYPNSVVSKASPVKHKGIIDIVERFEAMQIPNSLKKIQL